MEIEIGLDPHEMIEIYNRAYAEVWEDSREKVDWDTADLRIAVNEGKEVDVSKFVLQLLEAVMTSARDAVILTLWENNRRIAQELQKQGISLRLIEQKPKIKMEFDEESETGSIDIKDDRD